METICRCPDCGKIIALIFPLHDCTPTPNFLREKDTVEKKAVKKTARRLAKL